MRIIPGIFTLLLSTGACAEPEAPSSAPAADESRVKLMRALEAAKDQPFIEPTGDIKAMLLSQTPSLAAPDCGVRYKPLAVEGEANALTILVAPQGRCLAEPGMLPQWVLKVGVDVRR